MKREKKREIYCEGSSGDNDVGTSGSTQERKTGDKREGSYRRGLVFSLNITSPNL